MKPVRISRRIAVMAAATVLGAGTVAVVLAGSANAAPSAARHTRSASCTLSTLRGYYLFEGNGWSVSNRTAKPMADAGSERYDGTGHVRGIVTMSEDGVITRNAHFTATDTVAANCTGTETVSVVGITLHFDFYIAPSGDSFTQIETDPGSVIASSEQQAFRA